MVSTVDGGYFPATWGWVALSLLFVAASTLILADRVEIGIFEVFWLSLAALFLGSEPNSPNE